MTDFVLIVVIVGCQIPKASGKNQFCPSLPLFQTCRGHTLGGTKQGTRNHYNTDRKMNSPALKSHITFDGHFFQPNNNLEHKQSGPKRIWLYIEAET